ncbi:hypothetical protein BgiMline_001327, partial [Biomphalaria glabrata]
MWSLQCKRIHSICFQELYEAAVTTPNVIIQKILRSMTEKQKEKWEQSMLTCINTTYTL